MTQNWGTFVWNLVVRRRKKEEEGEKKGLKGEGKKLAENGIDIWFLLSPPPLHTVSTSVAVLPSVVNALRVGTIEMNKTGQTEGFKNDFSPF